MSRRLARALLAAACLAAAPALAQDQSRLINTPAERFQMAPGGVDMRTGRFVYDETDLAIGGGAQNGGLELSRTLTQPVSGHVNPFGNLSHNWDIMITERMINIEHPGQAAGDYQIEVHFGGRSQTYRSRFQDNGYVPVSDGALTTLTYAGSRASVGAAAGRGRPDSFAHNPAPPGKRTYLRSHFHLRNAPDPRSAAYNSVRYGNNAPGVEDLRGMRLTGVPIQTIGPDVISTAFRRNGQEYLVIDSGDRRKLPNLRGIIILDEDPE